MFEGQILITPLPLLQSREKLIRKATGMGLCTTLISIVWNDSRDLIMGISRQGEIWYILLCVFTVVIYSELLALGKLEIK